MLGYGCAAMFLICAGFTIQTRHGNIYVIANDSALLAEVMERLLMSKFGRFRA
ncbi:MAG: hypothetical protein ACSLEN_14265 [Candidatus Malihini olakiniferum]